MGAAKNAEDLPAEVDAWIGKERYIGETTFPIEMGYVYTSCASVENANPLFWDEKLAEELTQGPIAPPSMLSVWFRPHHWVPNQSEQSLPLQVHFDLKEALSLPEAVMTDNTIVFGVPVRPGDVLTTCQVLHSVSAPKKTSAAMTTLVTFCGADTRSFAMNR